MLDIIIKNLLNVIGILVLFYVSHEVKEWIVNHLTEEDRLTDSFTEYHHIEFHERRRKLIIVAFFACLQFSLLCSIALGNPTYNADQAILSINLQSTGIFIALFLYSYMIVLFSVTEAKHKHQVIFLNNIKVQTMKVLPKEYRELYRESC